MTRITDLRRQLRVELAEQTALRRERSETLDAVHAAGKAFAVAALVLLVFNSAGLRTWTQNLEHGAFTEAWAREAEHWHDLMQRLGFALPASIIEGQVDAWREARWGSATIDEAGDADALATDDAAGDPLPEVDGVDAVDRYIDDAALDNLAPDDAYAPSGDIDGDENAASDRPAIDEG